MLAGIAQERVDAVHASEQGYIDLVLKSYVCVVRSEIQTAFAQSFHRLAAAVPWNAASDAHILGAVGIVVEPQECLPPERNRAR